MEIALLDGGTRVVAFLPLGVAPSSCIAVELKDVGALKPQILHCFLGQSWAVCGLSAFSMEPQE